jgi:hypothetical protein
MPYFFVFDNYKAIIKIYLMKCIIRCIKYWFKACFKSVHTSAAPSITGLNPIRKPTSAVFQDAL